MVNFLKIIGCCLACISYGTHASSQYLEISHEKLLYLELDAEERGYVFEYAFYDVMNNEYFISVIDVNGERFLLVYDSELNFRYTGY